MHTETICEGSVVDAITLVSTDPLCARFIDEDAPDQDPRPATGAAALGAGSTEYTACPSGEDAQPVYTNVSDLIKQYISKTRVLVNQIECGNGDVQTTHRHLETTLTDIRQRQFEAQIEIDANLFALKQLTEQAKAEDSKFSFTKVFTSAGIKHRTTAERNIATHERLSALPLTCQEALRSCHKRATEDIVAKLNTIRATVPADSTAETIADELEKACRHESTHKGNPKQTSAARLEAAIEALAKVSGSELSEDDRAKFATNLQAKLTELSAAASTGAFHQ
jgi:hypothetical protein